MPEITKIFGAPGCGKTTKLMDILEKELETHTPDKIAYVTFTRQGASEGLNRALAKFPQYKKKDFDYVRTIHSLCFKVLGVSKYDILAHKDYKIFSDKMNMHFVGYYTEEFYHNDDRYLFLYFLKHNNYPMYVQMRDALDENVMRLKYVAHNFVRYKKYIKKLDFTDLLEKVVAKNITLDVDVAIIDEAQDLTTLQWKVCQTLFKNAEHIYIAGDDDQAIYEWTGADVPYFLNIEGEKIILDKSWRLKSNILSFVKNISAQITNRVDKDFDPCEEGGDVLFYNNLKDFQFNPNETYFCLSRNNYFLRRFEEELRKQKLFYSRKGKPSITPDMVHAINNYKKLQEGVLDVKERIRVKKMLKKDVTDYKNTEWYNAIDAKEDDIAYYRQLIANGTDVSGTPKINVSTIHGVKGGEADNVILMLDVTRTVYNQLKKMSDSELRCLYVGCTRAKKALHIVYSQSKFGYDKLLRSIEYDTTL